MMSEVFWTGLYSGLIGFVLAIGSQCYKSKCNEVKICCITIKSKWFLCTYIICL